MRPNAARRRTSDWASWPEAARQLLEAAARRVTKRRGEFVYRAGDTPVALYVVQKGLVGLVALGPSGKEHLLRFFGPGHVLGHRAMCTRETYHATATVLDETQLLAIPRTKVDTVLASHPELYRHLAMILAEELGRSERQRVQILDNQVLERVAQAVLLAKETDPSHVWTRQELANVCASTVPTVVKALAELEAQAVIAQTGRRIEILDRGRLLDIANR